MRCFVGIPLPADTRRALLDACEAVRHADPDWRGEKWVAGDNLHITVAFLGEVAAETIDPLVASIGTELAEVSAFQLPFARLRAVPNARRASMLWAAYDDPEGSAAAVAAAVGRACSRLDIALEERPFRAHVTLVRARRARRVPEHASRALTEATAPVPAFVSVRSATLFSSTLTKAGPVYTSVCEWRFPA